MNRFPYESQWGDPDCNQPLIENGTSPTAYFDFRTDGYPSESEYLFWSRHICGLACLRSVLRAWLPDSGGIPMYELIRRAERRKALVREGPSVGGLFYQPFVEWIRDDFGIEGFVHPRLSPGEILDHLVDGRVVLASVSSEIRYPNRPNARTGGHLVLVHAFHQTRLTLHNPSGVGETSENAQLDIRSFARFFANRGVTLRRPT